MNTEKIKQAAEILSKAKNIVGFTGAGTSAESGIPFPWRRRHLEPVRPQLAQHRLLLPPYQGVVEDHPRSVLQLLQ